MWTAANYLVFLNISHYISNMETLLSALYVSQVKQQKNSQSLDIAQLIDCLVDPNRIVGAILALPETF